MAESILLEEGVIANRYALAVMSSYRGAAVGSERRNVIAVGRRSLFGLIGEGLHGRYMYRLT